MSLSWFLIVIVVKPGPRNIYEAAACELIGVKKGRNFQFNLFL